MHPKRPRDQQQMAGLRLLAVLDPLDRAAVDAGQFGQAFLGEVQVQPLDAHAVADGPSGVEDPALVFCGVHETHATTKMILCPQQF